MRIFSKNPINTSIDDLCFFSFPVRLGDRKLSAVHRPARATRSRCGMAGWASFMKKNIKKISAIRASGASNQQLATKVLMNQKLLNAIFICSLPPCLFLPTSIHQSRYVLMTCKNKIRAIRFNFEHWLVTCMKLTEH